MIYRLDPKTSQLKRVDLLKLSIKTLAVGLILYSSLSYAKKYGVDRDRIDALTEEERLVVVGEFNEFSEEKLIAKIEKLNFRFPYIILAQAKLETGNFSSLSFVNANNMFGMKQAKSRANTAEGTGYGHAYYDSWIESLYDYALYYNAYLNKLRTEAQYYSYLSQNYAQDPNYVSKLKQIIEKENLKSKF